MSEVRQDDDAPPHQHELRLVAVHLEDGSSTREFRCEACQAVWFS